MQEQVNRSVAVHDRVEPSYVDSFLVPLLAEIGLWAQQESWSSPNKSIGARLVSQLSFLGHGPAPVCELPGGGLECDDSQRPGFETHRD